MEENISLKSKINNKSVFKIILIIVGIVILLLAIFYTGYLLSKNNNNSQTVNSNNTQVKVASNNENTVTTVTNDWQTYTNNVLGLSFKYPKTLALSEFNLADGIKSSDKTSLYIHTINLDFMKDSPNGYDKENLIKDKSEVLDGQYGERIDWPLEAS